MLVQPVDCSLAVKPCVCVWAAAFQELVDEDVTRMRSRQVVQYPSTVLVAETAEHFQLAPLAAVAPEKRSVSARVLPLLERDGSNHPTLRFEWIRSIDPS